ncbi:hypothetical protein ACFUOZ_07780 [Paenarthrobacter sp. NPDC057355]|uniref:hypothetical protein n=1 Tax=Paenarthrobacter sp. NPDC057355 TaxID=3346105 RepID=UPI0036349619
MSADVGPSGLNPTGGFALPDVNALDAAAQSLRQHADDFLAGVATSTAIWRGLSSSYSSDESPTVLAAFGTIMPSAQRVQGAGASTSTALAAFSATCRELKQRLEAYGRKVQALDADIGAFPTSVEKTTVLKDEVITTRVQQHWSGEADLTARHDSLASEVQAIHNDYLAAQNSCASALAVASGGETYTTSRPEGPDMKSGNWLDEVLWNAGTALGIEHPQEDQPWGKQTVPYRPNGTLGLLQGFGAGAIELIDGVYSFVGTGNPIKRQQAWAGMGAAVGALTTLALTPLSAWDEERKQREAPEVQKALDLLGSMGPAFLHAEEAGTNPNWAAGATSFSVASFVGSYGAGTALKSGAVASKVGAIAERLSVATVQSARLQNLSAMLGATANGLKTTGEFLAKPGSLTLKVSDILMPNTTAKLINTMAQARHASWAAISTVKTGTLDTITASKHGLADGMGQLANGLRAAEATIPGPVVPHPSGLLTRTGIQTGIPDLLENKAAKIRENNPPAFVPPKNPAADAPSPAHTPSLEERFPTPENITNTVTYRHGDSAFPVYRKENFAARTTLKPNTEYIIEHRGLMRDSTGALKANTIEKYYTDETGTVTRVDTYAGVKGAWSPELNKPMPNVTYNVVAQVDGGLQNTFTLKMDANGDLASAKGHITSTLVGDANRNGWQQLKAGRLGGPGYDGGHAAPSALGFIGERGGLFPQHAWQNRGIGMRNDDVNFHEIEMNIINEAKTRLQEGRELDLKWEMELVPGNKPGVPDSTELSYAFGDEEISFERFNNLPKP